MAKNNLLAMIATWVLIVAGLVIGVNGLFSMDVIGSLNLGSTVNMIIYVVFLAAGLYKLAMKAGIIEWE